MAKPRVGIGWSPWPTRGFAMGYVVLESHGGQVPWHNQEQEEVHLVLQGRGEICVGTERGEIEAGPAAFLPPREFHQLTNTGDDPLHMIYVYCPGGDVAHWRLVLDGSLPPAGEAPQCRRKP